MSSFFLNILSVLSAGTGFLADSYDIFAINLVVKIINEIHPLSADWVAFLIMSTTAGTIVGQIFFGLMSDKIGRNALFIMTASIIIIAAIGAVLAPDIESDFGLIFLGSFRFLMGIGIGGEYPLSSSVVSENAKDDATRGRQISSVFSMQGIGAFLATLVSYGLLTTSLPLNLVWRLILGMGMIPTLIAIGLRIHHYRVNKQERVDKHRRIQFKEVTPGVWKRFAGTSLNWFLFDIVFYGNSLLSSSLVALFVKNGTLDEIAGYTCLLATVALPGYWFAIWGIESPKLGRFRLQFFGFIGLLVLYSVLAGTYKIFAHGYSWLAITLYALSFFFANAGPNTTTFVLPSELFPTRLRATFHGSSAAAGKIGALIGSYGIAKLSVSNPEWVFGLCAIISALGIILTWFLTEETRGQPLSDYEIEEATPINL